MRARLADVARLACAGAANIASAIAMRDHEKRHVVGQMKCEDGAEKVHRGLTGLVKNGKSAGSRAYGYRPDPNNHGKRLIVEDEAAIIREIFELYDAG